MELKAHVWFPTLIWQATLPDSEKEMLSDMKDFILDIKEKNPEGVKSLTSVVGRVETLKSFQKLLNLLVKKLIQQLVLVQNK